MFEVQKYDTKKKTWVNVEILPRVEAGKALAKLRAKDKANQYRMRVQPLQDRAVAA